MRLNLISILVWCYIVLLVTTNVFAQNNVKKNVIIKSTPPGAMIYFEGENSFVGISPFKLRSNIKGMYTITATKGGYEKRKMEYFFKGTENGILRVRLHPKTRFKAAMRSFVFPGWGQFYSERKKYGAITSILQVSATIYTLFLNQKYNKKADEYNEALSIYQENKKNFQLQDEYWSIAVGKHKKAESAYEDRKTMLIISGGLWIYNILDSLFFFPSFENKLFNRSIPTISANFKNGTPSLGLSMSF